MWHHSDEMSVDSSSVGFSEVCEKNDQFSTQHQTRLFWKSSALYWSSSHTQHHVPL